MSTLHVSDLVETFITVDLAACPASKGQYGFAAYILNCSINDAVCHGVPDPDEIIRDGDIINLDITLEKNGFIAVSSKTYLAGTPAPALKVRVGQS
jgi:methionyl aminopeptidase